MTDRWINVGCGSFPKPRPWVNIDAAPIAHDPAAFEIVHMNALDFDFSGATLIYAGHVVEYMTVPEAKTLFRRIRQQAAEKHQLVVVVPAIDRLYHASMKGGLDINALQDAVFGGRAYPGDEHRSAWRVKDLHDELEGAGYRKVGEPLESEVPYLTASVPWQVCFRAVYEKELKHG